MGSGRMQVLLPVAARAGVFSWLLLCGVVGLRWGADFTRLCVCLSWFPALVPACVYRLTIASLCNTSCNTMMKAQCC